jgi:hypothetical protein
VGGGEAVSVSVKWLEHEVNHSFPSSAELKKKLIYTSTPTIRLHGVVLN